MKKQFDHWNVCSNRQVNYASSAKVEWNFLNICLVLIFLWNKMMNKATFPVLFLYWNICPFISLHSSISILDFCIFGFYFYLCIVIAGRPSRQKENLRRSQDSSHQEKESGGCGDTLAPSAAALSG